jgi:hypothetical protein
VVEQLELSFRRLILFSTLAVLVGIGVVYAIGYEFKLGGATQTSSRAEGTSERFGFKLVLSLEKTEYSPGEPVNVTLTIININNETSQLEDAYGWWDFLIYNDTNNGLYQWSHSTGGAYPHHVDYVSLYPGMGLTNALVWPQMCNETLSPSGVPNTPVSSGKYYIVGQYQDFGYDFNYNLETTPIEITIA